MRSVTELRTVLGRPAIQRYVGPTVAEQFLSLIEQRASFAQPNLAAPTCRDPGDAALIATAVGGRVDYLVTADLDLLDDPSLIVALANRGVHVVRASDFLSHLQTLFATEQKSNGDSLSNEVTWPNDADLAPDYLFRLEPEESPVEAAHA